jgi:hypothetical protein
MKRTSSIPIGSTRLADRAGLDGSIQNENITENTDCSCRQQLLEMGEIRNATTSGPLPRRPERFVRVPRNRYKSHP